MKSGVVVHIDDADVARQQLALSNVANLLDDVGEATFTVEVVANGPGIEAVCTGSAVSDQLAAIQARGVTVAACANALRAHGLAPKDLLPGVATLPAGISELVRRQHQGWAYIRP